MIKIYTFLLVCVTLGFQLSAQQLDSTWIKGKHVFEDGYYKADKSDIRHILVIDLRDSSDYYFVNPECLISLNNLQDASIKENYLRNKYIALQFEPDYHNQWSRITEGQIGREIVLMVNNQLIQGSHVNTEIPNGTSAINRNDFTESQLFELLNLIKERIK